MVNGENLIARKRKDNESTGCELLVKWLELAVVRCRQASFRGDVDNKRHLQCVSVCVCVCVCVRVCVCSVCPGVCLRMHALVK